MYHVRDPLRTESLESASRPEYRYKGVMNDENYGSRRRIVKYMIQTQTIRFKAYKQAKQNPMKQQDQLKTIKE